MATTILVAGCFSSGEKGTVLSTDPCLEFRKRIGDAAEDIGLTDEEFDESLELVLELRRTGRLQRNSASVQPRKPR